MDNFIKAFLSDLHDCHKCNETINQINGKGKRRTFCKKYARPVQQVRWHCIDRFLGFNTEELNEINRQYVAGECTIEIPITVTITDGVA